MEWDIGNNKITNNHLLAKKRKFEILAIQKTDGILGV